MKTLRITIILAFTLLLQGCYTQLAVRDYAEMTYIDENEYYAEESYDTDTTAQYEEDAEYDEEETDVTVNNYYDFDPFWDIHYSRYYWNGYYPDIFINYVYDPFNWRFYWVYDPWDWHYYDPIFYPYYTSYYFWDPYPFYYDPWYYGGYGGYFGGYYGDYYGGYYGGGYWDSYFSPYRYRDRGISRLRNTRGRGSAGRSAYRGGNRDANRGSLDKRDRNSRRGYDFGDDIRPGRIGDGGNSGINSSGLARPTKRNGSDGLEARGKRKRDGEKSIKKLPKGNNEIRVATKDRRKNIDSRKGYKQEKPKYKYKVKKGEVKAGKSIKRSSKRKSYYKPRGAKSGKRYSKSSRRSSRSKTYYKPRSGKKREKYSKPRSGRKGRSYSKPRSGSKGRSYSRPRSRSSSGRSYSSPRSSGRSSGSRSSGSSHRSSGGGRRR